ncbi:MAG: CBS domain-containing protein [Planctomycetes bacterium]|nr:CBS domain-containing protein [Planctomycetota bacterium]
MGELQVTATQNAEQMRFFMKCLLRDMEALEHMLRTGLIESDRRRIGAEQELFIVDRACRPALLAQELLETIDDPHFTPELALFNLECNLDPFDFGGACFAELEAQATELLALARRKARELNADVVMTGILPTLRQSDVDLDAITPQPRYFALNEVMTKLRGGTFHLHIKGVDECRIKHKSMLLEACNTSFQVHLQVTAEEFAKLYNISQLVAAPIMASAVNSPLLFGKRLWRETRLALFQQSIDTRNTDIPARSLMPRVSFGSKWVKSSVTEIFQEDISRFRALLGNEHYQDPFDALARGEAPTLDALRLHNGTVYRWNRACYGISSGKPHLRIENRLLPSGPSILDEVANAAFWLGLVHGYAAEHGDPQLSMDFDDAKSNLLAAARIGLDSQFKWIDGKRYAASELIVEQLLPLAEKGLASFGIEPDDITKYLGVIRNRVDHCRTGARWQVRSLVGMSDQSSSNQRLAALVQAMIRNQETGKPGHEWDLAQLEETSDWKDYYSTVESFMVSDIFTVHQDELVDLAAKMMEWSHIRHVPVEDDKHRLVGLVTHRKLLKFLLGGDSSSQVPVSEIMEPNPITIRRETPTLEAIKLMDANRISCLPILDELGRLVGIVTDNDFMGVARKLLQQKLSE